ncbi:protein of unknown function [Methylocella tundrae]|uniref:Uncharacterized protein n=1 Tax=Methylocella tundrae TaxID=227605 RepID=A0A4U8YXK3_METTU|nr:protein of unknown function [Methylocella tundrae]
MPATAPARAHAVDFASRFFTYAPFVLWSRIGLREREGSTLGNSLFFHFEEQICLDRFPLSHCGFSPSLKFL